MGAERDELRRDIEESRREISKTVDQIENRASPTRIVARQRFRIRQKLTDLGDTIMGNDDSNYRDGYRTGETRQGRDTMHSAGGDDSMTDSIRESMGDMGDKLSDMGDSVSEAPQNLRRKTRGNPMAVGLIAAGAGALVGGLLQGTRQERQIVSKMEPALGEAAARARDMGQDIGVDLRESASDSAEHLREEAKRSAEEVKDTASEGASRVSDQSNR